ncbi:hypothetical protein [Sphingopyxis flava]|uniref:hypothetical protein n=1 Tax=Sphingopyxis flava TaxID=1507287 RepID=UPI00111678F8|nr:hypothetical protein [Sphingopyxis flava]
MRVDLCGSPDKPAVLAGVGVVSHLGELALVDVPRATIRAVQDHRDGVIGFQLAGLEPEPLLRRWWDVAIGHH